VRTTSPESASASAAEAAAATGNGGGDGAAGRDGGASSAPRADRPRRFERLAFLAAVVTIIVYLVLAYLVFVRPGANRGDHVLAALVPAAILALSAELYPGMPAWLRSSSSLVVGIFAMVSGLVAVDRILVEGASAGALCGILPLLAGAALIALGVRTAWVFRRRGGPLWRTVLRRALITLGGLVVVYWVVLPVSLAIVATERPARPVRDTDLGRPKQDVTLVTRDGVRLSAWYVPSKNGATIVTFPREWTVPQARMLVKNGYGVLMVDPRGYGESEGDPNAYGWGSTRDIDAAVAWLRRRPEVKRRRIGGLGLSMGGEQMLEDAARNRGLKAVVSEGAGIRSVREAPLEKDESVLERVLTYPQDLVQTASVWLLGGDAVPMSLKNASLLIAPRAVMFIYGEDGQAAEKAVNPTYYESAFPPKTIWEVPGAGHTEGIQTQPEDYQWRVLDFFDRVLLGK
jgi:fermentation-respiration switch protein FrsA (DUF1100 family)